MFEFSMSVDLLELSASGLPDIEDHFQVTLRCSLQRLGYNGPHSAVLLGSQLLRLLLTNQLVFGRTAATRTSGVLSLLHTFGL